jgi:multiple sugar transport system permease protein
VSALRDRSLGGKVAHVAGLAILSFVTIFPLYTIVISSLKPLADVRSKFQWVPSNLTLEPYKDIWHTIPLAHYFVNSLIVSVSATVISVTLAIFAAYAISRYMFKGRSVFSATVLSTQMFPGILFLLPLFVIFVNIERSIGIELYGTYLGLIVTYLTFSLPFSIWMLVGYFNSIPRELEEAAMTEGATPIGALFRILIPVSMPGIAAVAIYAFITAWGEVLFASVLTTDETRTLAIGLRNYSSETNVYWNQLMAAAIVVSAPVVVGFLAAQRWIVRGLTAGGVK